MYIVFIQRNIITLHCVSSLGNGKFLRINDAYTFPLSYPHTKKRILNILVVRIIGIRRKKNRYHCPKHVIFSLSLFFSFVAVPTDYSEHVKSNCLLAHMNRFIYHLPKDVMTGLCHKQLTL